MLQSLVVSDGDGTASLWLRLGALLAQRAGSAYLGIEPDDLAELERPRLPSGAGQGVVLPVQDEVFLTKAVAVVRRARSADHLPAAGQRLGCQLAVSVGLIDIQLIHTQ